MRNRTKVAVIFQTNGEQGRLSLCKDDSDGIPHVVADATRVSGLGAGRAGLQRGRKSWLPIRVFFYSCFSAHVQSESRAGTQGSVYTLGTLTKVQSRRGPINIALEWLETRPNQASLVAACAHADTHGHVLSFGFQAEEALKTLKALVWEGSISDALVEAWTAKTGWGLDQIAFDNDDERDRILSDDRNHSIDLVVVSSPAGDDFGKRKRLQRIDQEQIPNRKYLDVKWQNACGDYSIPYSWGTLGIVYRADKVAVPLSWRALLEPEAKAKGHIGMVNDVTDTFAPVLAFLGHPLNTADAQALQNAYEVLRTQGEFVLTYQYAYTWLSQRRQDETLWMALGYSGDHHALNELTGTGCGKCSGGGNGNGQHGGDFIGERVLSTRC